MQVQKKDKDGNPIFDKEGKPVMEEGAASPDPNETAKKLEALEKRQAEVDGKLMAANERASRAEALLESYIKTGAPAGGALAAAASDFTAGTIDATRLITEPEKVLAQVKSAAVSEAVKIMEKRYREAEGMKVESENVRTSFYKTNPDLVGFERIVGQVEQEYRMRFPNTVYSQLLPEIAKAARAEVLDMQKRLNPGGRNELPLGLENGGGASRGGSGGGKEEPPISEEADFASYMKERNEVRTKKLS